MRERIGELQAEKIIIESFRTHQPRVIREAEEIVATEFDKQLDQVLRDRLAPYREERELRQQKYSEIPEKTPKNVENNSLNIKKRRHGFNKW